MTSEFAYSFNEEDYHGTFDTEEAAMKEGFGMCPDRSQIFIGKVVRQTGKDLVPSFETVIEHMMENAYEMQPDYADVYLCELTGAFLKEHRAEMQNEFDTFFIGMLEKRGVQVEPTFFTVTDVKKHEK